jgi:IMP dehydrogenase
MVNLPDKLSHLTTGYTYDDVLIVPAASAVEPTEADPTSYVSKNVKVALPIVSAPMDRVTESAMCIALGRAGALGVLHRNMTLEEEVEQAKLVKAAGVQFGAAVGPFDIDRARALDEVGVNVIIVDCAHGHNTNVIASARRMKQELKADIVVGNIATAEAAEALCEFADGLRVGVGPGATCTTRIITGSGVPQLTAVHQVAHVAIKRGVPVIADGGLRYSGDMVKALAAGASVVMNGSLFGGTDEAPGEIVTFGDKQYKSYRGMGSLGAISGTDRYGKNKVEKAVPEGIEGVVKYRGSVESLLNQLVGGIKAGMGYVGATTIAELQENARFIRMTPIGNRENHPHSMIQTKDQPNYPAAE